jgi:hypothetical protein
MFTTSSMTTLYMPYQNNRPLAITVNGHNLLIVTADEDLLLTSEIMDVEYALPIEGVLEEEGKLDERLVEIAENENAGIVVAPTAIPIEDVIKNLELELPWLQ